MPDVSNVKVLGANSNLFGVTNFGNPAIITIESCIPNVGYIDFLESSRSEPFLVGLVYLLSTNLDQLLTTFLLKATDSDGNNFEELVVPTLDPYQDNDQVILIKKQFVVDGNTEIIIDNLAENQSVTARFYPIKKTGSSLILTNDGSAIELGAPEIIRTKEVVTKGEETKEKYSGEEYTRYSGISQPYCIKITNTSIAP